MRFTKMSNRKMELAEIKGLFMELSDLSTDAFTDGQMSESSARDYVHDVLEIISRINDKIANLQKSE